MIDVIIKKWDFNQAASQLHFFQSFTFLRDVGCGRGEVVEPNNLAEDLQNMNKALLIFELAEVDIVLGFRRCDPEQVDETKGTGK